MEIEQKLLTSAVEASKDILPDIYKDGFQPTVRELGKGLHTLSKTINIALSPISAMVWGYEKISEYVQSSLERKLKNVPEEKIVSPDISIAGPTLESLRFVAQKEELKEMFSNLLASSMNSDTKKFTHPSFVEIIKQINSDEAKILKMLNNDLSFPIIKVRLVNPESTPYTEPLVNFSLLPFQANCENVDLGPSYIDNLVRLGIINISYTRFRIGENVYDQLENHEQVNYWKQIASNYNKKFEIIRGSFLLTDYGKTFYQTCIAE